MDTGGDTMLKALSEALLRLPAIMERRSEWTSLIVNRRKPWTYRASSNFEHEGRKFRVCLHRFEVCDEEESFLHPHPWPGAFAIIQGSYIMGVGYSKDRLSKPDEVVKTVLAPGSRYAITNPLTWHSVTPLEECYTVMVNGEPWNTETMAHSEVRTTKGKDLDQMSAQDLDAHFAAFWKLITPSKERWHTTCPRCRDKCHGSRKECQVSLPNGIYSRDGGRVCVCSPCECPRCQEALMREAFGPFEE